MQQEFMNEILADKKDRSDDIFWNYFQCQNPSLLAKDLITAKQDKNEQLVNNFNEGFIDLRNAIIKEKKFLQMKIQIKQQILLKKSLTLINIKNINS